MRRSSIPSLVFPLALFVTCTTLVALGPAVLTAQGRKAPPKPASGASAPMKMPEVVVGGIQVAKVVVSDDDWSAKPFNSSNGTKLVLWVKMPSGTGLIEIDDDTSLLSHFGDDKGTDLGGSLDSFPDEFKDGSGATMDITSDGMPAAGATALVAEGTLVMNVATGTKPTKVWPTGRERQDVQARSDDDHVLRRADRGGRAQVHAEAASADDEWHQGGEVPRREGTGDSRAGATAPAT